MTIAGESSGNSRRESVGNFTGKRKRKVGLLYDERMCKHDTPDGEDHPECPNRIKVIWEKLQLTGLAQRCVVLGGSKAEDTHLQLVHTKKHVNLVKRLSTKKKDKRRNKIALQLDSIYLNGGSSEASYLAAGSVVEVAEKVAKGELDRGFAIVRPPGHHAEEDEAMGFCLFNNVAVAASYLLNERVDIGIRKIPIVDWDVHHGNGTVHRHDAGNFYPTGDDGDYDKVGEGPGEGFNINVPWNLEQGRRCGDTDYLAVWDSILIPVTKEFNPDIILLSAGFDAAIGDPLGGCFVTPYGYSAMLKKLMEFAQGKIVMALEGGYNLDSVAKSSVACVQVLLEDKPIQGSSEEFPLDSTRHVIEAVRKRLCAYWPSLANELPWKAKNPSPVMPTNKRKSPVTGNTMAAPCESHEDRSPPSESSPEKRFSKKRKPNGKAVDRRITREWTPDDQMRLNLMNKVTIVSTRFVHKDIFVRLGIWEDTKTLFEKMGLAKLCTMNYPTYTELAREFLASVRVTYNDEAKPLASQGTLSFKIGKQLYSMKIIQLCEVFGFKTTAEQVSFPELTTKHKEFWSLIGTGEYDSSFSKQSCVRNPVLRCALKVISSVFFARASTGSVQQRELVMLFNGVKHLLTDTNNREPVPDDDGGQDINYGSILAAEFVKVLSLAHKSGNFRTHMGGLITPILEYHKIDLTKSLVNETLNWIDKEHLLSSKILFKNDSAKFIYRSKDGTSYLRCILPQPDITSLTSKENLAFRSSREKLCAHPPQSSARLPCEEEELGGHHHFDPEKYKLPPPPVDPGSQRKEREWMCNAVRINHALLIEIWKSLASLPSLLGNNERRKNKDTLKKANQL